MIAWFAVVFGINSTHNAVNCTRLRLMQFPPVLATRAIKVTGYSCARRVKCIGKCILKLPRISGTKSMSNLILEVEVRCHKVQGMTEAFTDTLYSLVKTSSSVQQKAVFTAFLERDSR